MPSARHLAPEWPKILPTSVPVHLALSLQGCGGAVLLRGDANPGASLLHPSVSLFGKPALGQ